MIVPQKLYKKKVIPPINLNKDDKAKPYTRTKKSNQNLDQTNSVFIQIPKKELARIFQFKGKTFCMKVIV